MYSWFSWFVACFKSSVYNWLNCLCNEIFLICVVDRCFFVFNVLTGLVSCIFFKTYTLNWEVGLCWQSSGQHMCVPYVYGKMVGMQLVNRLFNTHIMHLAFQRTYQVKPMHNPLVVYLALLHLTSSILHPAVTFKALKKYPRYWPAEFSSASLSSWQNWLEFPPVFVSSGLKWIHFALLSHFHFHHKTAAVRGDTVMYWCVFLKLCPIRCCQV